MYAPQPADNFGSQIRTEAPFKEGLLRRASMAPQVHRAPSPSRSAFARALSDQTAADMRNAFEQQSQEYRQKAEEARSRDVQSRRDNQLSKYGLGREKEVTLKQQDTRRSTNTADIDAYMDRVRQDHKVNKMSNMVDLFLQGSLFAAPTATQMWRTWKGSRPDMEPQGGGAGGLAALFQAAAPAVATMFGGPAAGVAAGAVTGGAMPYSNLFGGTSILGGLR